MLGKLRLGPGEQGGGVKSRTKRPEEGRRAPAAGARPAQAPRASAGAPPWQAHRSVGGPIDAAIRQQAVSERRLQVPDWIQPGSRVGYVSKSSGKRCEVMVDKVSRARQDVKIVFVEDPNVWKIIPFSMILSPANPLRQLGVTPTSVSEMFENALSSKVDKSVMLQRAVGPENSAPVPEALALPRRPVPLVGSCTHKAIPDAAITASSYYMNNKNYGFGQMWCTRIDCTSIGWRASADTPSQCLRWDFGGPKQVVMVQTKGSLGNWVETYHLSYTTDGTSWTRLDALFTGNRDQDSLEESVVDPPVVASMLRLHPVSWHGHIGLRAEVLGFDAAGEGRGEGDRGDEGDGGERAHSDRSRSPRGPAGPELPSEPSPS